VPGGDPPARWRSLEILGVDPGRQPATLRDLVGVQLQTGGLPGDMQVGEAMRFFCAYHRVPPRADLLERLGLQSMLRTQYRELSTACSAAGPGAGDRAQASRPDPGRADGGLDVGSRTELHALMEELREGGTAILLATHDMAEAEKLADRVAILLHGKIVATGSPRELTATGSGLTKVSVRTEESSLSSDDVSFPAVQQRLVKDEYAVFYSTDPARPSRRSWAPSMPGATG